MAPQQYSWTCSICSYDWTLRAIGVPSDRMTASAEIGYPHCVNETYGLMSADCLINAYHDVHGFNARQAWVTFEQAYSLARHYTGCINPIGMYHFMGIRGVDNDRIWVANSAPGYKGVYDILDRERFNALGPVQVIYLESRI